MPDLTLALSNPAPQRTPDTPKEWEIVRKDGTVREFHLPGGNIQCPVLPVMFF
jgi:hypothetical protein